MGRGRCSVAKWPQNLKCLHDDFSSSLLNLLSSRFALVGGECAKTHVRKFIYSSTAAQRRSFSVLVKLAQGLNLDEKVNRIITFVNHPLAMTPSIQIALDCPLCNWKLHQTSFFGCWKRRLIPPLFKGKTSDCHSIRSLQFQYQIYDAIWRLRRKTRGFYNILNILISFLAGSKDTRRRT